MSFLLLLILIGDGEFLTYDPLSDEKCPQYEVCSAKTSSANLA